jgi:hypothetical protein
MSIADHFDHTPDAGFIRTYDAQTARRQFQVSAVAAFALGLLVRFDDEAGQTSFASPAKVSEMHFAGQLPDKHI